MKKLFSFLVLGFFIFQISNPFVIYASLEDTLEEVKQETSAKLDTLEVIADKTIATLDTKTSNQEIESQLEEKSQEIEVYLEEVQAEVQDASSQTEVTQILEEAKKVVVLKVVAGATEYSDIEEGLPKGEALTPSEKEIALETLQESIEQETTFTLMIATKYSQSQVQTLLSKFDAQIEVKLLYISDDTNYFQLTISQQSIFAQEILQDIQDGTIPESFVGIEIIQPEVFTLENLTPNPLLVGEGVDSTWGIKSYNPVEYIDLTSTFSSRIKVGIVDTGIQLNHPDLAGNISPTLGYDFVNDDSDASDDQGHGTHVAGTIGAMNNGSGIIGVNPNVELVPLKICNASGFCPSYAIIKAIDYAKTHHIPVLNMSLGGRGTVTDNPICAGIDALTAQGTIVVSAAGNSNVDTSTFVPGGCPSALTVGAYDQLQKRASFSNYGAKVDVSAPGVSIYSTHLNSGYKNLSGTSMATPHIVGVVSLLKSLKPSITRSEVISLFNQHKVLLNAEVGKSIASGVDLVGVIQSLTLSQAENQTPPPVTNTDESEEVSSALSTPTQTPASDVVLNPNIEFVPNQEAKALEVEAKNAELISQAQQETETVGIANVVLDFLGLGSRTEINSLGENLSTPEEQVLPLTQEPYKGAYQIADVQYFDENGNPLSDVAIANVEDEGEVVTGTLLEVGQEPVYIDNGEITENQSTDTLNEEVGNTVEILIDGAQNPIAINSIDEEELVETPLVEYIPQDITQVEGDLIEPPVEHLDYSYEREVFIDGATSENIGNSVGGEGYDPLSLESQFEEDMIFDETAQEVSQIIATDTINVQEEIPTDVSFSMYRTKQVIYPLSAANTYQYTFSQIGKVSLSTNSGNVFINGNVEGETKIYASLNGVVKYIFTVDVLPWPEPEIVDITTVELERIYVYFPANSYKLTRLTGNTGQADISASSNGRFTITGNIKGNVQFSVVETRGEMSYIPKYILNITVLPVPPIVENYEVYVGRQFRSNLTGNISLSQADIVNTSYSNGRYSFIGLSAGDVEVYYKDGYGRHTHTLKIKVLPIPVPLTYAYNLTVGDDASVTLPEPMANYILEIENTGLFDNYKVKKGVPSIVSGTNSFYMRTDDAGIAKVHLIDPVTRFDKYLIVLDVKAREAAYSLNVTDKIHIAYNDNRNYYNQNPELFKFSGGDITGLKAGVGQIISRYEGRMRTIYTITVNPIPEPKQITCNTLAGKDCWVGVNYDRYSYTVSGPTVLDRVERTGSGIRVYTKGSGIITLYLKSVTGNYTSHVLTVNVASKPPLEYDCTIPVGYSCLSYDTDSKDGYSFSATNLNVARVSLDSFFLNPIAATGKYYQYKITGLKEGTGDVYIYRYNDHIATVRTTILPPVTPLSLQTTDKTIKEGERIRGQLTGGVSPYSLKSVKIKGKDVNGNETLTTSTDLFTKVDQTTGEVTITAKQRPGNYTVELKDKYDQTVKFGVTVLDSLLNVSASELTLKTGDSFTLSVRDYYMALEPITVSDTTLVRTHIVDEPNPDQPNKPRKYLQIEALKAGEAIVGLKDIQGNIWTVRVIVNGENVEEEEDVIIPSDEELEEAFNELHLLYDELGLYAQIDNDETEVASYTSYRETELQELSVNYPLLASKFTLAYDRIKHLNGQKAREHIPIFEMKKNQVSVEHQVVFKYIILKLKLAQLQGLPEYTTGNIPEGKVAVPEVFLHTDKIMALYLSGYKDKYMKKLFPKTLKDEIERYKSKLTSEKIFLMDKTLFEKMFVDYYTGLEKLRTYEEIDVVLLDGMEAISAIGIATEEVLAEVADLGLELTSGKSIYGGLETLILYYSGEIEDLEARDQLLSDLNEIKNIVNPGKKWTALKNFAKVVKGKKLTYDWKKLQGVTWSKVSKPDVTNDKLKKIVLTNYLPTSIIGNGSTADALRYEKKTGILTSPTGHKIKTIELRNRIKNWLNSNASPYGPKASESDIKHAKNMLDDLDKAFNEVY